MTWDRDNHDAAECDERCSACDICQRATGKEICRAQCCHAAALTREAERQALVRELRHDAEQMQLAAEASKDVDAVLLAVRAMDRRAIAARLEVA